MTERLLEGIVELGSFMSQVVMFTFFMIIKLDLGCLIIASRSGKQSRKRISPRRNRTPTCCHYNNIKPEIEQRGFYIDLEFKRKAKRKADLIEKSHIDL